MTVGEGTEDSPPPSDGRDFENLFFATGVLAVCQFALHSYAAKSAADLPTAILHAIAFAYDLFLLTTTALALQFLGRYLSIVWQRNFGRAAAAVLVALGLTLASYPLLLTDFLTFPVNVFRTDGSIAGFFVGNVLGLRGILVMLMVGILAILGACSPFDVSWLRSRWVIGSLSLVCLSGVVGNLMQWRFLDIQPHPLVYSIQESVLEMIGGAERVVPQLARSRTARGNGQLQLKTSPLERADAFHYEHVYLLVMETVDETDFASEFQTRPDGFYSRCKDHTACFKRYYATNLDSYTSLLAMLTSVQVPFRAYARPGYYDRIIEAPNMVQALEAHGWKSLFVCTAMHQPFVPVPGTWSAVLHGRDFESQKQWVAVAGNAVEAAIEDRAAIKAMVSFAKTYNRTLVMHEMVYGHSPRWGTLTGKGQLRYYEDFFQELYDELNAACLVESTLLVIVADHGSRMNSAEPEHYHVPLVIVGKGVEPDIDDRMYSHLDLQQIVGHYLCDMPDPQPRENVLVVGHSARWVYGQITSGGESTFLDAQDGVILSQAGTLAPKLIFAQFQGVIDSFARYLETPRP